MSVASVSSAPTSGAPQTVIAFNQSGVAYGLPCSALAARQDCSACNALYLFYAIDMVASIAANCDRIDVVDLAVLVCTIVHGKHVEVSGVRHSSTPQRIADCVERHAR